MIFALAGRKGSGKTTVSKILLDRDFKKASFGTGLKEYVAKLYDWSFDLLSLQKYKEESLEIPVLWNKEICEKFSLIVAVPIPWDDNEQIFNTRRAALQFIGTEVLRRVDPDFHVKEFLRRYKNGDFVCDDLRFPNELKILKEMGAKCIFLLRPYHWDYSNHKSETSLSYKDFDYIFLNDTSEHKLIRKAKLFINAQLIPSRKIARTVLLNHLEECEYDTKKCAEQLDCSRDKIIWWTTRHMINVPKNKYSLNHQAFSLPTPESSYWAGILSADGSIKKHLKYDYLLELGSCDFEVTNGFCNFLKTSKPISIKILKPSGNFFYTMAVTSPYIVNDLKLWSVEPRKTLNNKVPDVIRDNNELLCYWLVGLIDGDGCISLRDKGKNISIRVLASNEIIDFVNKWLQIPGSITREKNIDNLFNITYTGKNAVAVYNKIYKGIGLKRKWSKIEPYLNKKWHH